MRDRDVRAFVSRPSRYSVPQRPAGRRASAKTGQVFLFMLVSNMNAEAEPTVVRTKALAEIALYPEASAPATVVSLNDAVLSAETPGHLVDISARVGDKVTTNAVLARIDAQQTALKQARLRSERLALEAKIRLAEWQLQQNQRLATQQVLPEEKLRERRAQLDELRAEVATHTARLAVMEHALSLCSVRAPFAGVVIERLASVGQYVNRGDAILRVMDDSTLEVSARIPSAEIVQLQDQRSDLIFRHGVTEAPLRLRRIVPLVNTASDSQEVRLEFDRFSAVPGTPGQLLWKSKLPHIPADLLVKRGVQLGVFTDDNGHARFQALPDAQAGRPALVHLPTTTRLIVVGQYGLNEGDPLNVEIARKP